MKHDIVNQVSTLKFTLTSKLEKTLCNFFFSWLICTVSSHLHAEQISFSASFVYVGGVEDSSQATFSSAEAAGASMCDYLASIPGSGVIGFDHLDGNSLYCLFSGANGNPNVPSRVGGLVSSYICPDSAILNVATLTCILPEERHNPGGGGGCPSPTGPTNPIKLLTGEKVQVETDFVGTADGTLAIRRWYSSQGAHTQGVLGYNVWRLERYTTRLDTNYDPSTSLLISEPACTGGKWIQRDGIRWSVGSCDSTIPYGYLVPRVEVSMWNGKYTRFKRVSPGQWVAPPDKVEMLKERWDSQQFIGWEFTNGKNEVYLYDADGIVQEFHDSNGAIETLIYDLMITEGGDGDSLTLDRIDDHLGNSVFFTYMDGKIDSMTDVNGATYQYTYIDSLLSTVTYPDADTNPNNNPLREYHYELSEMSYFYLLTGITDERGVRYANWSYDGFRAISSSHGVVGSGIDEVTIDYSGLVESSKNGSITITNALGRETVYHYTTIYHSRRLTRVEGEEYFNTNNSSIGCAAADQYYSYDSNGYLDIVVDWEGNAIDYTHDSRGLEVQRIEGLTATVNIVATPPSISINTPWPAEARTIFTKWHPNFRLPTRITEPDRVVDMTYDCSTGRLDERKVWALGSEPTYAAPSCP